MRGGPPPRDSYVPRGRTLILNEQLTRDQLSVMSGITLEYKLLLIEQQRAFSRGKMWLGFLKKHALRQIPGKLLVI